MADTPRGPRPTVTRTTARVVAVLWLLAAALATAAAIAPTRFEESGWTRERLDIVELPYGDCEDGVCTITPTLELPSGERTTVEVTVRDESELLPSNHFRTGGSMLMWVHDDREPRSLRPIEDRGTTTAYALLAGAGLLAALAAAWSVRARKLHAAGRAGHVEDHLAIRLAPLLVVVLALGLLLWVRDRAVPIHEPLLPDQPSFYGE